MRHGINALLRPYGIARVALYGHTGHTYVRLRQCGERLDTATYLARLIRCERQRARYVTLLRSYR